MKAGFHWICQIARCCGEKYVRKRLPGRSFSITDQICLHCHGTLAWNDPPARTEQALVCYRSREERNRKAGRTAHGSPAVRFPKSPTELAYAALKAELAVGPKVEPLYVGFKDASGRAPAIRSAAAQGFMHNLVTRREQLPC